MNNWTLTTLLAFSLTSAFGATTYYLDPNYSYADGSIQALTNAYYWTTKADGTGKRLAETPEELKDLTYGSSYYYRISGAQIDEHCTVRALSNGIVTNNSYALYVGDSSGKVGAIVNDLRSTSSSKNVLYFRRYAYFYPGSVFAYANGLASTTYFSRFYVYGTAANPTRIAFGATQNGNTATFSGVFYSQNANSTLILGGTSAFSLDAANQTNSFYMSSKSASPFYGHLIVSNDSTKSFAYYNRTMTFKTRSNVLCTLTLGPKVALQPYSTSSATQFRDLELGDNSLLVHSMSATANSRYVATNLLTVADGAQVAIYLTEPTPTNVTRTLTLLTGKITSPFTKDDFHLVGTASDRSQLDVVTDETAQTKSLVCYYQSCPADVVFMKAKGDYNSSKTSTKYRYSAITNRLSWSDGAAVSSDNDYWVRGYAATAFALRTPWPTTAWDTLYPDNPSYDFTFPGKSLTIDMNGVFILSGPTTTVSSLTLNPGATLGVPSTTATDIYLKGSLEAHAGTCTNAALVRVSNGKRLHLGCDISGAATLDFCGWNTKNLDTICLEGDNSNYRGRIIVSSRYSAASYSYYELLKADSAARFGGNLETLDPDALRLQRYGAIETTGATTITAASNRGISVGDYGQIIADARLSIETPVTLEGCLRLKGPVALSSLATRGTGASLSLNAATLEISDLDGLRTVPVSVVNNSTLTVVKNAACATDRGLDLSGTATPITVTSGKTFALLSSLASPAAETVFAPVTNALLTVQSAFAASARTLIGSAASRTSPIEGLSVLAIAEETNEDGSVTFKEVLGRTVAHVGTTTYTSLDEALAAVRNTTDTLVFDVDATPVLADGTYHLDANGHTVDLTAYPEASTRRHTVDGVTTLEVRADAGELLVQLGATADGSWNSYWTFTDAIAAAVAQGSGSAYLKVLRAATSAAGFVVTQSGFANGLTLDLNGKSVTFTSPAASGSEYAVKILKGNALTVKNGTLSVSNAGVANVLRSYAPSVTFEDVRIDGTGITTGGEDALPATYRTLSGTTSFTGSTALIAPTDGYAFVAVDHSGSYSLGGAVFDTTGEVKGNFLLCGGTLTLTAGAFDSGNRYFYGAGKKDCYVDGDWSAAVARIGASATPTGTQVPTVMGELFAALPTALAAVGESATKKVVVLADTAPDARLTYAGTADVAIDLNGHAINSTADVAFVNAGTGKVTIGASGSVVTTSTATDAHALWAQTGDILITGGTFENNAAGSATIFAGEVGGSGAPKVTIKGGVFRNNAITSGAHTFGVLGVATDETSVYGSIEAHGGSIYRCDPAKGDASGLVSTFVRGGTYIFNGATGYWNFRRGIVVLAF